MKPIKLSYLLASAGRSGSVFIAKLLTSAGLPCGHESIFDWHGLEFAKERLAGHRTLTLSEASIKQKDIVTQADEYLDAWVDLDKLEAESSYMCVPFLSDFESIPLIHVVRHPVRVVNSFCNYIEYFQSATPNNHYESFIYNFVPELQETSLTAYDRAALFYVRWNEMIERAYGERLVVRWKVEKDGRELLSLLGKSCEQPYNNRFANTYQKPGSKRFFVCQISHSAIKADFVRMGEAYGYIMKEDVLIV
jgi:hypothetical protein